MGFKAAWLPHLELLAEADKSDVRSDAGVLPEPLRQNRASVLVDRKDFACPEERGGEVVTLVRVRSEPFDQPVDLVDQPLAAGVERGRIKRRIAINAVKTVLGEDCAEGSRNGDAALGVDLICKCRHKLVHLPLMGTWLTEGRNEGSGARPLSVGSETRVEEAALFPPWPHKERCQLLLHPSPNGQSWDNMGYNGWSRNLMGISLMQPGKFCG